MKKLFILSLCLTCIVFSTYALEITGRIVDSKSGGPVGYSTISLLHTDSTLVAGTQSANDGSFTLAGTFPARDYLLRVSFIGYTTAYIQLKNLNADIQLGDIDFTEDAYMLTEASVSANRIIHKVDRQIILPSRMEVKSSVNAFDLLSNMSLPRLLVDPVNRTIKAGTEEVQLRINGVKSTMQDIVALRAQDISRVEYYDEPGVRFGNEEVGAVINFIVIREKEREHGGYISIDGRNAPFVEFGDDQISVKSNYKASEFSLYYAVNYRGYDELTTDKTETFNFPGNTVTRERMGLNSLLYYQYHDFKLAYNLTKPDKYVLDVSLKDKIYNATYTVNSITWYSDNPKQGLIDSRSEPFNNAPVLDVYFRREMKNKQSLMFNVVGTYIRSESEIWYNESEDDIMLTSIYNHIKGDKYSAIAEVVYNKEFESISLSAGLKHTQGKADNRYTGWNTANTDMHNADSYAFAQMQGKIKKKLGYTLGVGVSRIWFKEGDTDVTYFRFRPSFRLSYPVNNALTLRYSFNVNTSTPSLGQLSNVEQQDDRFIISRGNPGLKPYNNYTNRITASFKKGIASTELNVSHSYMHRPFMDRLRLEGNNIISAPENYKAFQRYGADLNASVDLIKDVWNINGWIGSYHFQTRAEDHTYNYTNFYGGFRSNTMYKNYILAFGIYERYNSLWGERVNYGESWNYIEAGYKHNELRVSLGVSLPFQKQWSAGGKNLSDIAPSKYWDHLPENGSMVYARFSWNISIGKQHKAGEKKLDNADTDTGILK